MDRQPRGAFDPAAPDAARWRAWLVGSLADRGVPPDTRLEMRLRPAGEVAFARLSLDAWWTAVDGDRHARADALIPARRLVGHGWSGWPAYQAAIRLLRGLS